MICFICKVKISSVNLYIQHLKKIHDLSTYSNFKCRESSCSQEFQNISTFKRHIIRKHEEGSIPNVNSKYNSDKEYVTSDNHFCEIKQIISNSFKENLETCESYTHESFENKENKELTIEDSLNNMFISATRFVLKMHDNNSFSRKNILEIQEDIQKCILNPMLESFRSFSNEKLAKTNIKVHNEFVSLLSKCRNPFNYCNTEYKLLDWLKKEDFLDSLNEFSVNNEISRVFKNGCLAYDEKNTKGILMPLKFQFKKFFESGNILNKTKLHMETLSKKKKISNFVQGELWKKKCEKYPGKILIPYFLYTDDFEINNPLSSHAGVHSICNIYYSFPCLPWKESKLDSVFLAGVLKTRDLKAFGNE